MNLSLVAKGFAGLALVWLACESKEKKPAKPLPGLLPVPPAPPAPPAPSPSGPTGSASGTGSAGPTGQVWTHENRTSSDGKTAEKTLPDLTTRSLEPVSPYLEVSGQTFLKGVFKWEPFAKGSDVTQDAFDQVETFFGLSRIYHELERLGFDIPGIIASLQDGRKTSVRVRVNAMADLNAYFDPSELVLSFGTGNGKFHTASDGDIAAHEFGHYLLHALNPELIGLTSDEGGAIHEGFGDGQSTLAAKDPEVGEDIVPFLSRLTPEESEDVLALYHPADVQGEGQPASKDRGLRTVANVLALSQVSHEVHDRGKVYGGFQWSLFLRFKERLTEDAARDLTLMLAVNHGPNYSTGRPKPKDFAAAYVEGAKALARVGRLPIPLETVTTAIEEEAKKREIVKTPAPEPDRWDPSIYEDLQAAEKFFGREGTVGFRPLSVVPFIGGKTAYYRQQYRTRSLGLREKFARVDVIGHGLQVRFDQNGKLLRVHPNDVRPIAPGEIDERMKVTWADAVRLARQKLKKELDAFKQFPPKTETEARRRYALLLCEAFRKKVTRYERNLVVMDDGKALSYAIDLRFGVFYVNTRETLDPDKVIFESRILF